MFDTIIVGALALPWALRVIHLFLLEGENRLEGILEWVDSKERQAAAGVLLFAMSYTRGSTVSRMAQDFFPDGDLHLQVGTYFGWHNRRPDSYARLLRPRR